MDTFSNKPKFVKFLSVVCCQGQHFGRWITHHKTYLTCIYCCLYLASDSTIHGRWMNFLIEMSCAWMENKIKKVSTFTNWWNWTVYLLSFSNFNWPWENALISNYIGRYHLGKMLACTIMTSLHALCIETTNV
jgi:hypothetical protein